MFTPLDVELFILGSFLFFTSLAIYFILNYGKPYAIFFYTCFLKPFSGKKPTRRGSISSNQQDALESFYKGQAAIYDATRVQLLKGREDMLALAATQLKLRAEKRVSSGGGVGGPRPIWVDIGGGTGYAEIKLSI
jgi:betaine lipid synthase